MTANSSAHFYQVSLLQVNAMLLKLCLKLSTRVSAVEWSCLLAHSHLLPVQPSTDRAYTLFSLAELAHKRCGVTDLYTYELGLYIATMQPFRMPVFFI